MNLSGIIKLGFLVSLVFLVTMSFGPKQELSVNLKTKKPKTGLEIGDKVPDIKMKGLDGKTYRLHSLKGRYILLDFWASWCSPCRRENPNLVAAYRKYQDAKFDKGKGFEVFSVSLDKDLEKWKKAIESDHLSWPYHVCDFGGWSSEVGENFKIKSIPYNFLIGPDLTIIAKDLRGDQLHQEIDKRVKAL